MQQVIVKRWEDLRGGALAGLPARSVAVLPVGATEHHGPHLPFGTDTMILDGVLRAASSAEQPGETQAWAVVLPVQPVGWSVEHGDWPGTLSFGPDQLAESWVRLGSWAARAGFRRVLILNGHGGNAPVAAVAAMRLRSEHGLLAARAHWQDLAGSIDGPGRDWHAGHIETSVMLHLRPDLVDMGAARAGPAFTGLPPDGPAPWAWMSRDLDPGGVIGDPGAATAAFGAELVARAASGLRMLLSRLASTPWPD